MMTVENQVAMRDLLERAIKNQRTKEMLCLRFGFEGEEHTYASIAKIYGVCDTRVAQIIQRGLRDLRKFMKANRFHFEDFFEPEEI